MLRFSGSALCASAAALSLFALTSRANAQGFGTPITPGPTNVTFTAASDLGTTVPGATSILLNTMTGTFDTGATGGTRIAGSYISEVYEESGGTLDFYYQFTNSATLSTGPIFTFGVSNFKNVSSSVGYTSSAVGSTVTSLYSADGPGFANETNGSIDTIAFDFSQVAAGGVAAGGTSVTLLVSTNATTFTTSNATFSGAAAANGAVFAPGGTAAAPEPGSLALIFPGILGIAGIVRRRKSA